MTGGMCWEAMGNIGACPGRPVIVVLNDNGRSYGPTVGSLGGHLGMLRLAAASVRPIRPAGGDPVKTPGVGLLRAGAGHGGAGAGRGGGAGGLAMAGLHRVVAVYATFLNRAFDQVLMDVALHRLPVTFVLDRAGVTGPDGPSHHGMWDACWLPLVPGLRLAAPRDPAQLRALLREAVDITTGPAVIRYPKATAGPDIPAVRRIGGVDVLREDPGAAVLLVAVGATAPACLAAAGELVGRGVPVTVVDPRWTAPLDPELTPMCFSHPLRLAPRDTGRTRPARHPPPPPPPPGPPTLAAVVDATLQQVAELTAAGCQIVRVAVPSQDDADALPLTARKSQIPVIADIRFQPKYVFAAISAGCAAVRVNPGNIKAFDDKVAEIAAAAAAAGIPIRIGVNAGSLDKPLAAKYGRATPPAPAESALREAALFEDHGFTDLKISVKHHDPLAWVPQLGVRLVAEKCVVTCGNAQKPSDGACH